MFTGIIEEMGVVKELSRGSRAVQLHVLAKTVLEDLSVGDSVSVNGVCLTAAASTETGFSADLSSETLDATNLGRLKAGDPVNLERSVRAHARLGGHLVSGHVDGIGVITKRFQQGETILITIDASPAILRYCVKKGSIAVDGISLTINEVTDKKFQAAIVPHTARVTTLGIKGEGAVVNLECDLIGKYVERLLTQERPGEQSRITPDYLKQKGML